jgi:hypothetical protein
MHFKGMAAVLTKRTYLFHVIKYSLNKELKAFGYNSTSSSKVFRSVLKASFAPHA